MRRARWGASRIHSQALLIGLPEDECLDPSTSRFSPPYKEFEEVGVSSSNFIQLAILSQIEYKRKAEKQRTFA